MTGAIWSVETIARTASRGAIPRVAEGSVLTGVPVHLDDAVATNYDSFNQALAPSSPGTV